MQITSISYSHLVSLGAYENEKIGGTAVLNEQDDPVAAMMALRAWVDAQINTQKEIKDLANQRNQLQHDLNEVNMNLKAACRMWDEAKRFLRHHGVKPPPDPWWWTRKGEAEDDNPADQPIPGLP